MSLDLIVVTPQGEVFAEAVEQVVLVEMVLGQYQEMVDQELHG